MKTGVIKKWDDNRGFGFISTTEKQIGAERSTDVFVHISQLPEGVKTLTEGQRVTYETGPGKGGREQAVRVQLA